MERVMDGLVPKIHLEQKEKHFPPAVHIDRVAHWILKNWISVKCPRVGACKTIPNMNYLIIIPWTWTIIIICVDVQSVIEVIRMNNTLDMFSSYGSVRVSGDLPSNLVVFTITPSWVPAFQCLWNMNIARQTYYILDNILPYRWSSTEAKCNV